MMYTACVSLFWALQRCDIYWKRPSGFAFLTHAVELSRKLFFALPHLLSYWPTISVDDLRLLAISEIHQEDCCHDDNGGNKAEWSNPGSSFSSPDTLIWHEPLCLSYTHTWFQKCIAYIQICKHTQCSPDVQQAESWDLTLVKHKHTPQPRMGMNRHPCGLPWNDV